MPRIRGGPLSLLAGLAILLGASASAGDPVLDFEMKRLDGVVQDLREYRGRVVLVVNVASRCGFTPQYAGLQRLYERYRERGFLVLGFPANDFANQEPGSDAEIAQFCRRNYGVSFPMFSKIHVVGPEIHPLYARLARQPDPVGGPVSWNFEKYLVDRRGHAVARFAPATKPEDASLRRAIEALLDGEPGER